MKWEQRKTDAGHIDIYIKDTPASAGKVCRVPYSTNTASLKGKADLITAAPALHIACHRAAVLLADYDESRGEEGEVYRELVKAVKMARGEL